MGEVSSGFGSGATGDMRVLFIITVRGHGRGGHFHSLNHISQAMGEIIDVGICTYGTGRSQVLEDNPYFNRHIYYNGRNFITYKKEIKQIVSNYKPDILHFFDVAAYNTFSLFFNPNKYKVFLNKCGGPNPREFPLVQNLILFSEENQKWFNALPQFSKSNITVIPNRVNPKVLEFNFNKPVPKKDAFCFVRIARIGKAYKKSIEDSIRLIQLLSREGLDVHLYIIGAIQEKEIAEELRLKIVELPITMLHDDFYTQKASDMLYLADAVIATGRGIMEATALGKPILTPALNAEYPILINEDNFEHFFATNFSERNIASKDSLKLNLSQIRKLVIDKEFLTKMSGFSKEYFDKKFSTNVSIPKYLNFYSNNAHKRTAQMNVLTNLIFKLKTWYSFIK